MTDARTSPLMRPERELSAMLEQLFSEAELRRLLDLHGGDEAAHSVPSGLSLADLAHESVKAWDRRRLIDDAFFELLHEERPRAKDDIAQIQRLFADSPQSLSAVTARRRRWALVAGSGGRLSPSRQERAAAVLLGEALAASNMGLVTCGWSGVDEIAARAFATAQGPRGDEVNLLQILRPDHYDRVGEGIVEHAASDAHAHAIAQSVASVVFLLRGGGGTRKTGTAALTHWTPVIPLAWLRGDALKVHRHITRRWAQLQRLYEGITLEQFKSLARRAWDEQAPRVTEALTLASALKDLRET